MATTIKDLPLEIQDQIYKMLGELKDINTPYEVVLYNENKTRYLRARRKQSSWNANGCYMPFGGGSQWRVVYGRVCYRSCRNVMGQPDYELTFNHIYQRAANGTFVPEKVCTKKEVLALAKEIGIFNV